MKLTSIDYRLIHLQRKVHNTEVTNETIYFVDQILQGRSNVSTFFQKNLHSEKITSALFDMPHLLLDMIYTYLTEIVTMTKGLKSLKDLGVSTGE